MKTIIRALGVVCALGSPLAFAQDNTFDIGVINFQINSTSPDISGHFTPPGLNLSIGNATTLYLGYLRRINDDVDFNFEFGLPPEFDVTGKGLAAVGSVPYAGVTLAKVKSITPAAFINYNFLASSSPWRPYVGLGVNYTHFYAIHSTAANNAVNGGPTNLGLTESIGPAAQVGVRYRLMDRWSVNFAVATAVVNSDLSIDTAGNVRRTSIDFHPFTYTLSAGYSF